MKQAMILDTGPLVALISQDDRNHRYAKEIFSNIFSPLLTCEAVIVEACFLLRNLHRGQEAVFNLIDRQVIQIVFDLASESQQVQALMQRYDSVPMSVADACLVRIAELYPDSTILTLDSDFLIYRKNRNQTIPVKMP
jgi:uncharacterized protein